MKNNIFYMLLLTALTFMVGSCSDDDESTEPTIETPAYLKPGTDVRPTNWIAPDASLFELRMTV